MDPGAAKKNLLSVLVCHGLQDELGSLTK